MLVIDSNPSAFDDLDADPTSTHNSMVHANGSFGDAPPTQSELVIVWLLGPGTYTNMQ